MTAAEYPVPATPGTSVVMTRPLVVPSPAGPADMDHVTPQSSTRSVDCSSALPLLPVNIHVSILRSKIRMYVCIHTYIRKPRAATPYCYFANL